MGAGEIAGNVALDEAVANPFIYQIDLPDFEEMVVDEVDIGGSPDHWYLQVPYFNPDKQCCAKLIHGLEDKTSTFFFKILTVAMMEKFVAEINNYAALHAIRQWQELSIDELKRFLAIVLFVGVVQLPE